MGKAGRNEMKKATAGFLNGVAVAVLASGCIIPVFGQNQWLSSSLCAVVGGLCLHLVARMMVRHIEE